MAIPNLIGVLTLSGTVAAITNSYCERTFGKEKDGRNVTYMLSHFPDIQKAHEKAIRAGEI